MKIFSSLFIFMKNYAIKKLGNYKINTWDQILHPRYYYDNFINPCNSANVLGIYEYTARDIYLSYKSGTNTKDDIKICRKQLAFYA